MAQLEAKNLTSVTYIQGKSLMQRTSYGVCSATVSSRYLKEKMLVWLRLLANEFAPIPADIV